MKLSRAEFKALQKYWYDKAKQSGFIDAETFRGDSLELKSSSLNCFRDNEEDLIHAKEEYFTLIAHRVTDPHTVYKDPVHKFIMMAHSEGSSIKGIVTGLQALGESRDRKNVRLIIRRYAEKWKIAYYRKK